MQPIHSAAIHHTTVITASSLYFTAAFFGHLIFGCNCIHRLYGTPAPHSCIIDSVFNASGRPLNRYSCVLSELTGWMGEPCWEIPKPPMAASPFSCTGCWPHG